MRYRKPTSISKAIAKLRREEGWNSTKRKESLSKNKQETTSVE